MELCKTQTFVSETPVIKGSNPYENPNTLTISDAFVCTLVSADNTVFDFNYIDTYYQKDNSGFYIINDSITIKKTQRLEKNYLITFNVYTDGEHTAEFATNCRTSKNSPFLKYKAVNDTFYSDYWRENFFQFIEALGLVLYGITDFDIALDTNQNTLLEYKNFFLNSGIVNVGGHYMPVYPVCVHMLTNCNQFVISPARKSIQTNKPQKADVKFSIYNKSKEIVESSNKFNITKLHERVGIDITKPVFRNELHLGKNAMKGITVEQLTQEFIESLFRKHAQNLMSYYDLRQPVIQPNGKPYDKNRNYTYKRIDILDLTAFSSVEIKINATAPEKQTNPTQSIKTAFRINFNNYIHGQADITTLQNFVTTQNNYLVVTPTYCNDLETENRIQYQHLTKKCIDNFLDSYTPEMLERLNTVQDKIFYNDIPTMPETEKTTEPEFTAIPRVYSGAGRTVPSDWNGSDGSEFVTSKGGFNQAEYLQMLAMIENKYAPKNKLKLVA